MLQLLFLLGKLPSTIDITLIPNSIVKVNSDKTISLLSRNSLLKLIL